MEVRSAVVTDLDRVRHLMDQLGHPLPDGEGGKLWATVVTDAAHDILVAEANGIVVAMIDVISRPQLHHGGMVATVDSLVVDSSLRGGGIGTRLLELAVERATARGACLIELTSSTTRKDTHRFYQRQQFDKNGVRLVRATAPV